MFEGARGQPRSLFGKRLEFLPAPHFQNKILLSENIPGGLSLFVLKRVPEPSPQKWKREEMRQCLGKGQDRSQTSHLAGQPASLPLPQGHPLSPGPGPTLPTQEKCPKESPTLHPVIAQGIPPLEVLRPGTELGHTGGAGCDFTDWVRDPLTDRRHITGDERER